MSLNPWPQQKKPTTNGASPSTPTTPGSGEGTNKKRTNSNGKLPGASQLDTETTRFHQSISTNGDTERLEALLSQLSSENARLTLNLATLQAQYEALLKIHTDLEAEKKLQVAEFNDWLKRQGSDYERSKADFESRLAAIQSETSGRINHLQAENVRLWERLSGDVQVRLEPTRTSTTSTTSNGSFLDTRGSYANLMTLGGGLGGLEARSSSGTLPSFGALEPSTRSSSGALPVFSGVDYSMAPEVPPRRASTPLRSESEPSLEISLRGPITRRLSIVGGEPSTPSSRRSFRGAGESLAQEADMFLGLLASIRSPGSVDTPTWGVEPSPNEIKAVTRAKELEAKVQQQEEMIDELSSMHAALEEEKKQLAVKFAAANAALQDSLSIREQMASKSQSSPPIQPAVAPPRKSVGFFSRPRPLSIGSLTGSTG
jgi:uncharacterized coiled-coil protein SlyX